MKQPYIIVMGAGPAGLMAATEAARAGARVLILEKMKQPGRKLAITGKGRCNITNIAEIREFIGHFGNTGKFLYQAFSRFFNNDLMALLEAEGVRLVKERGGRVFAAGGKAAEVRDALVKLAEKSGAKIHRSSPVDQLLIEDNRIRGVMAGGRQIKADAVILACGGASYPLTGSTGDGYLLASEAGHRIIETRPALVPLKTSGPVAEMADLNLRNIRVRMFVNGKKKKEAFGELVFARFGVTGPVILTLSGAAVDAINSGKKVELALDLKPALDEKKLDARLLRDFQQRANENMASILRGLVPREMVPVCLDLAQIPAEQPGHSITAKQRRRLRLWLKDFRLTVTGYRPMAEAIVTAGGVDTKEINPRSMESKLVENLYFAGEIMDIQASTGGYNLQAAFSTGWIAGRSAGRPEK